MAKRKAKLDNSSKRKEQRRLKYEKSKAKKLAASLSAALSKKEDVPPNHPAVSHPDSSTGTASPSNEEESAVCHPEPPPPSSNEYKTPSPHAKPLDVEKTLEYVAAATEYVEQLSDNSLSHKDKMKILQAMKTSDFLSSVKQLI